MPLPRRLRQRLRPWSRPPGGDGRGTPGGAGLPAPEEGPDWGPSDALTVEGCRRVFDAVSARTVGVEEELMLLSPQTLDLSPASVELLDRLREEPYFHPELRASQIEIVTGVCDGAGEVAAQLLDARTKLAAAAAGLCRVAAAGTHPFSTAWGEISAGERYRRIEDEYSWAARRSMVCGLHVHVGVGGADRSLAVYNALRSFLPEIAALAANSPFLEGEDTGLCSIRPKLNEALPRTGVPPPFPSWEAFVGFLAWGRTGGLFPDGTFLWWDLRPHTVHGTLELRVADAQTRLEDAVALAALVQTIAAWLARRFDRGERLPVHDTHRIAENSWRAVRYGIRGHLVDLDSGRRQPTRERVARLLDRLEDTAARIGCEHELIGLRSLLAGNGADRQRYVAEREGMIGLVEWLVRETEPDRFAAG